MNDASQDLRCQIVLKCLDIFGDVDAALNAADRVESYVRNGSSQEAALSREWRSQSAPAAQPRQAQATAPVPATKTAAVSRQSEPQRGVPRSDESQEKADAPAKLRQGSGPKRRWNPDDERVLREMWESGAETSAIADTLQRTPASVRERARALSLVRRKAESPQRESANVARAPMRKSAGAHRGRRAYRRGAASVQAKDDGPSIHDIEAYRIRRPTETLETVINFVRSRDYSVTTPSSGEIVVDGHRHMSKEEFISWANSLRRHMNKSEFSLNLPAETPEPSQAERR